VPPYIGFSITNIIIFFFILKILKSWISWFRQFKFYYGLFYPRATTQKRTIRNYCHSWTERIWYYLCLNQDIQDLRIFRMLLADFWWGVGDFILSESGFPGFKDFQDVVG
jgi:hypothetical protein